MLSILPSDKQMSDHNKYHQKYIRSAPRSHHSLGFQNYSNCLMNLTNTKNGVQYKGYGELCMHQNGFKKIKDTFSRPFIFQMDNVSKGLSCLFMSFLLTRFSVHSELKTQVVLKMKFVCLKNEKWLMLQKQRIQSKSDYHS